MRLWSLHPVYLDSKGLVALWREALLAKHVLEGRTKGYRHHPQLLRFREDADPVGQISRYLQTVYNEAITRGYNFDKTKITFTEDESSDKINVTQGQLMYEMSHLLNKLSTRDRDRYNKYAGVKLPRVNPLFNLTEGDIEQWEKQTWAKEGN
jgi:hypothetical protein